MFYRKQLCLLDHEVSCESIGLASGEFTASDQSYALMAKRKTKACQRGFIVKIYGGRGIGEKDACDQGDLEQPHWRGWKCELVWYNKSNR